MTPRLRWLLDTNVVSEMMRPDPDRRVREFLGRIGRDEAAVAAVTVWEILNGIRKLSPGRPREQLETRFRSVLTSFRERVLDWTSEDAQVCARIMEDKRSLGESLDAQLPDAMLAAVAVRRDLTILTRNVRDFRNTGARWVNPWEAP